MKIILSCTTTYKRAELFYYCVQSLINQTFQPDIFLINISKEPYLQDDGFSNVPDWMNNNKITVKWVENTGSYRKLIPVLEYADTDDLIVTADDDVIYGKTWLAEIVDSVLADPSVIVCAMGRNIKKSLICNWQNYYKWNLIEKRTRGLFVLPIGCAGIGYKTRNLDLEFLTDKKYLEIAPTTDDLWFKMASMRKNIPVSVIPEIGRNNTYMKDCVGALNATNLTRMKSNSVVLKLVERVWIEIGSYLGINQSRNDFSWDAICKYSKLIGEQEQSTS